MDVVNIFSSDANVASLGEVQQAGKRLLFGDLTPDGPDHLVDGPVWAFVDWVMEDMAGLEMCRRLRADPRTGAAHITMVLETPDGEDQRRALRAGADDYMVGPLDRARVLDRVLATENGSGQRHAAHRFVVGDLTIDMLALQARALSRARRHDEARAAAVEALAIEPRPRLLDPALPAELERIARGG